MLRPQCTKRFMVDVGHKCNMNCKFCYHHHEGDLTKSKFIPHDDILKEIGKGISRGNNWCDFTGGEPTLLQELPELISILKNQQCGTTVITNGVVNQSTVDKLISSGLDEFLVSIHGTEDIHDTLTLQGARKCQLKFLEQIKGNIKLRFNFVLNQFNQKDIVNTAKWMLQYEPSIVNFINFNPHHEWKNNLKSAEDIIAGLFIVEQQLNEAIKILEQNNIGVNIRYYPMCRISEEYRRCICNDLHVVFDPYEWDYCIPIKTVEKYLHWGIPASMSTENKAFPCSDCDLQYICGGVNKYFLEISGDECLTLQKVNFKNPEDKFYFYYYRQYNEMTLQYPVLSIKNEATK